MHRALELVGQLSLHSNTAQPGAVNLALSRLLNSNLSAKYWVKGRLDQGDIITNCDFFDAGLVSPQSYFCSVSYDIAFTSHVVNPYMTQ